MSHTTARIQSVGRTGLQAHPIEVEVDIAQGLPAFIIVGLPDAAVSEARDRVRSAIKNSGFQFPLMRVTVNLAPADRKKVGPIYDLPIAIGILIASKQLTAPHLSDHLFVGELALDGRVRSVQGLLALLQSRPHKTMVLPASQTEDAQYYSDRKTAGAETLRQTAQVLAGEHSWPSVPEHGPTPPTQQNHSVTVEEIRGQELAVRALTIAAAGGHNILLHGPPGAGKSMLARALVSLLPPLRKHEQVEVAMIHSLRTAHTDRVVRPPFRSPHHGASTVSIIGGGTQLHPGDITLAHNGVLFLDELAEFRRDVLESLRQPMEDKRITIQRAHGTVTYPADAIVVAAYNPCPCGFAGSQRPCTCSMAQVQRYAAKVSGPLKDRFDMKLHLRPVDPELVFHGEQSTTTTAQLVQQVVNARAAQSSRHSDRLNARLSSATCRTMVDAASRSLLQQAMHTHLLSMRGTVKAIRVARTIADLAGSSTIQKNHLSEAIQFAID